MNEPTDAETLRALQFALNPDPPISGDIEKMIPGMLEMAAKDRAFRLQLEDTPPESEREILRCAPPFDAQAEHEKDLEYESRVDYASWETDQPE